MGMFDEIINDYKPLGLDFQRDLHTKDLDNLMHRYYLDPSGKLYLIDYSGTQDFTINKTDQIFPFFDHAPNGNRGKVVACNLTDYVVVYPSKWGGNWQELPEACIHFVGGIVRDFYYGKHFQIGNKSSRAIPFKKEGGSSST